MSNVHDNQDAGQFELREDGHLALAAYQIDGDIITFTHTEVPPELGGRGVGSRLIAGALAQVEQRGLQVVPACSFVAAYMSKHPEFDRLRTER